MIYYPISKNCETRWSLFTDKCTNFSCNNGYNISCVLSQVQQVFLNTFGAAVVNAHPVLAVLPTNDNPVTFREYSIIFLSANGAFYNQYIYQFSHELCHFMVSNNVCMPFRWF